MRIAALLALLLALSPAALAQAAMERPAWATGDTWDFFVRGQQPGPRGPVPYAFLGRMLVAGEERIEVNGTGVDAVRIVEVYAVLPPNATAEEWAGKAVNFSGGASLLWLRKADGHALRQMTLAPNLTATQGPVFDYPQGCATVAWPFVVGRNETVECSRERIDAGGRQTGPFRPYTSVLRQESVTVHAGTFEAFVVDTGVDRRPGERQWWSPEACWRVRSESGGSTALQMELLGYRCGDRSGGALFTAEPPLDAAALRDPRAPAPSSHADMPGPGLLLVALGAGGAALLLGRRR